MNLTAWENLSATLYKMHVTEAILTVYIWNFLADSHTYM